jgi:serine acetyltransferase
MREEIAMIRQRDPAAQSALEVMLLYNGYILCYYTVKSANLSIASNNSDSFFPL